MADYVTKIRTTEGDKQIDYEALAKKPIANGKATQLITLYGDPTESMHAATKRYVDAEIERISNTKIVAVWG